MNKRNSATRFEVKAFRGEEQVYSFSENFEWGLENSRVSSFYNSFLQEFCLPIIITPAERNLFYIRMIKCIMKKIRND